MTLQELRDFLYQHLTEVVMPFWFQHGIDWDHGGLFSHLDADGTILDRNKSMVSNTRALWTFSALANRLGDREDYRKAADNQYAFLTRFGRDEAGMWVYVLDECGNTVLGEQSIITDAFVIGGMVEYFHATGHREALDIATATYHSVQERLTQPGPYKTAPYPTPPGMRPQREAMQFSLAFAELGCTLQDATILEAGLQLGRDVLDHFYRPEKGVLLEYLGLDNQPQDTPAGRCMVPGHAIESLWFQMHIFGTLSHQERHRAAIAAEAVLPCLTKGWDDEYGGIVLGMDIAGQEPVYWKLAEMKRWWPVTEAMPALLLAYEQLGDEQLLDWYWRVHEYAFTHFPNRDHGDWHQNLTRTGEPIRCVDDLEAADPDTHRWIELDLRVKDPFHLPRGLIVSINTLDRLLN